MPRKTTRPLLATVAIVLALSASTAGAATTQDLRSPDARDAQSAVVAGPSQDLRSPDARDATIVRASVPSPVVPERSARTGDGFDWASAGIGAGALMAASLLLAGVTGGVRHARGGRLAV